MTLQILLPTQDRPPDLLSASPPRMTAAQISEVVMVKFAIGGAIMPLTSERDQNFLVSPDRGTAFVVKVSNPSEDRTITDMQTKALLHVEKTDPALPVPRVIRARDGNLEFTMESGDGGDVVVRMFTFLDGAPLHSARRSVAQRRNLGECLAKLGLALRGFFHPAAGHDLQWDIKNAGRLRDRIDLITDADRRRMVERFLHRFETSALPSIAHLRAQIVHNDFNPYNILVGHVDNDHVTGILDFGDMVHTALVNDLAVGASYQISAGRDPLDGIVEFAAGYSQVMPLEAIEIELLLDLIAARLVTTVVVTNWRASQYPDNSTYILRNSWNAWTGLERLIHYDRGEAQSRLFAACRRTG